MSDSFCVSAGNRFLLEPKISIYDTLHATKTILVDTSDQVQIRTPPELQSTTPPLVTLSLNNSEQNPIFVLFRLFTGRNEVGPR